MAGTSSSADRRTAARDLITAAVLAAITAVYAVKAVNLPSSGATRTDLGPQVYPLIVGLFLALTTVILGVQGVIAWLRASRVQPAAPAPEPDEGGAGRDVRWWALAGEFVVTVAYLWVLELLGFVVATAIYLALQLFLVGGLRRYHGVRLAVVPVVFGIAAAIVIYILFAGFLGVLLPPGLWAPDIG